MKTTLYLSLSWRSALLRLLIAAGFLGASLPPLNATDLFSPFNTDSETWRTSENTSTSLVWQSSGGNPGGYLHGSGTNALWYYVSPTAWAGDWRGYRVLKFDLAITSRHYSDADRTNLIVIVGTNGAQMSWTSDSPLFTWTHYEVGLLPAAFGVSPATFDGIMAGVAELRIRGEYTLSSETVGLDNVLVTTNTPPVQTSNLVSRFTFGFEDWRPVDDVTLTHRDDGRPCGSLYADDWRDGRTYKIATPLSWAGDWGRFHYLQFDMKWTGQGDVWTNTEIVRISGANGQTLSWFGDLTNGVWQRRDLPLTPATFGVDDVTFAAVMSHVSQMWIVGEFSNGDDLTQLDNVILAETAPGPRRFTTNLVSRFNTDTEGWAEIDNGELAWTTNGFSGGALNMTDVGSGSMKFQSPDAWAGDWRNFKQLRFMLRSLNQNRADYDSEISIVTWDGTALRATNPPPYWSWTPYTLALSPATFGVTQPEYDRVMSNAACLLLDADLVTGYDTTALDNMMLMLDDTPGIPAEHSATFDNGVENWRVGDISSSWIFTDLVPDSLPTNGSPGGCIANSDWRSTTLWFSPESWAGDWRGLQGISFDFKILSGTSLLTDLWMVSLVSAHGSIDANLSQQPRPGQWEHYEFAFKPETFNVSSQTFEKIIQDVVMVVIRSEWISGSETELLDNVRLLRTLDPYANWAATYFTRTELGDDSISGKNADPDGDGMSSWSEFVAGTVPTNGLDLLRIEHVIVTNTVGSLNFKSRTGRLYGVERAASLTPSNIWTSLTNGIPGSDAIQSVPIPGDSKNQFYRLRVRHNE